jgi:gliding motility-associated-like protein
LVYAQQNLVYNGDFEEYSSCPTNLSSPNTIPYEINKCINWTAPTKGTSDYFHQCNCSINSGFVCIPVNASGIQDASNGEGYVGFCCIYQGEGFNDPMWWEYIQGMLVNSLIQGKLYKFSMELSLGEYSDLMIKELGVYFSNTPVSSSNSVALNVSPQIVFNNSNYFSDTINWVHLESFFLADGGENFITIGNFKDNIQTDTLRRYSDSNGFNPYIIYFYIDDVRLTESEIQIPNVFTPNGDDVNDFVPFPNFGNSTNKIVVVNRWGNLVFESNGVNPIWDGKDITGKSCTEGTYFYRINNTNISGFIQLVR